MVVGIEVVVWQDVDRLNGCVVEGSCVLCVFQQQMEEVVGMIRVEFNIYNKLLKNIYESNEYLAYEFVNDRFEILFIKYMYC